MRFLVVGQKSGWLICSAEVLFGILGVEKDFDTKSTCLIHYPFLHAVSGFQGFKSPLKVGYMGQVLFQWPLAYEAVYNGWSLGMSGGLFATSGSGNLGSSGFIYRSGPR